MVPKAGTHTAGLDRFFSSLYGKPIPGVAFFTLGLVNTRERRAYPVQVEQLQARESCKRGADQAGRIGHPSGGTAQGEPEPRQNAGHTAPGTATDSEYDP